MIVANRISYFRNPTHEEFDAMLRTPLVVGAQAEYSTGSTAGTPLVDHSDDDQDEGGKQ